MPNTKFEDGDPDVEFFDNARGQWKPVRAWFGTLVENVVQGTARDLLATAIVRAEARGWSVVFHCHDEIVIEVPEGSVSEQEVLALLLEPPAWAAGLPLGGKVHSGPLYLEAPETAEPPPPQTDAGDRRARGRCLRRRRHSSPRHQAIERGADEDFLANLGRHARAADRLRVAADGRRAGACRARSTTTRHPSCKIYPDHFYCYGCGERGDRIDWLTRVEGMTRTRPWPRSSDWSGPATTGAAAERRGEARLRAAASGTRRCRSRAPSASAIWPRPAASTSTQLPPTIHEALRFHPNCVFGAGARHPCIVALMRDPVTDAPVGIHRIGLAQENGAITKIDRKALGRMGVVKLWPAGEQLVVGEGIETVLAAATRISYRGAALTPAWSAVATRRSRLAAGAARRAAAHPAGRQRRERRGAEGRRALPAGLARCRAHRGAAGAEASGLGLQRRGAGEAGVSDFDDDIEEMPEPPTDADAGKLSTASNTRSRTSAPTRRRACASTCRARNPGRTPASIHACRRNRCSTRPERRCATPRAR